MRRATPANKQFTSRTYSVYSHMLERAKGARVDFTLEQLRVRVRFTLDRRPLCWYCNAAMTAATWSLDHLVPVSRGGSYLEENTHIICSGCNKSKGDFTHVEYEALLKALREVEQKTRNAEITRRVLTALRVAQSFRQGANRRAKRS